jgi:hypothetical protein
VIECPPYSTGNNGYPIDILDHDTIKRKMQHTILELLNTIKK